MTLSRLILGYDPQIYVAAVEYSMDASIESDWRVSQSMNATSTRWARFSLAANG